MAHFFKKKTVIENMKRQRKEILNQKTKEAAIAQWIRLRLPSCGPGFKSQSQHLGTL